MLPDWIGGHRAWFTLPPQELAQHGVVVGGSGTGKTVTLLRIAYLAAKYYGWQVFFVDAKGSRDTAAKFMALMRGSGLDRVALFPEEPYNGFVGDGNGILNRLMAIEEYSERFYHAAAKRLLDLACNKDAPPRSSSELLERLEHLDLAKYRLDKLRADTVLGVELRYGAFFQTLKGLLNGMWSYDTVQAAYIRLDGLALKEEAASLGRYLIEDFAHYAARRKKPETKALLIIDEYSALSTGTDAANLFERLREFGAGVIVSVQGYDGLGDGAERMLDACKFIIVHRSPAPERLIARAGLRHELTEARQERENGDAGGTIRLEERSAIDPNAPRQLETGEVIVISQGRYRKIRIAPAPIDPVLLQEVQAQQLEQPPAQETNTPSVAQEPEPEHL